jgi:hypothetical protein
MLAFFGDTKEIFYHTLWDVPLNSGGTTLVSTLRTSGSEAVEIDHRNDPDMSVLHEMALSAHTNPQVHPEAHIFTAVPCASKYGIHILRLFPEVFHADCCTCDSSNVTGNSLLPFSCRTSAGKQVVFLKIWIPNQKRFSFWWVFTFVLTSLIPANIFKRTRLAMVDRDTPSAEGRASIQDLVNGVRAEIASATSQKWNIDNCQTVNVNVEESNHGKRRVFASKNC